MNVEKNLKKLNIVLPEPPNPVGAYTAFKRVGNLLFVSGQISLEENGNLIKGKVGSNLDFSLHIHPLCRFESNNSNQDRS